MNIFFKILLMFTLGMSFFVKATRVKVAALENHTNQRVSIWVDVSSCRYGCLVADVPPGMKVVLENLNLFATSSRCLRLVIAPLLDLDRGGHRCYKPIFVSPAGFITYGNKTFSDKVNKIMLTIDSDLNLHIQRLA